MQNIPNRAQEAAHAGRLIEAIKIVHTETGLDLRQSKDAVGAFLKAHPAPPAAMSAVQRGDGGSGRKLVITALVLAVAAALLHQFGLF